MAWAARMQALSSTRTACSPLPRGVSLGRPATRGGRRRPGSAPVRPAARRPVSPLGPVLGKARPLHRRLDGDGSKANGWGILEGPPKLPIGVRAALTITTSCMVPPPLDDLPSGLTALRSASLEDRPLALRLEAVASNLKRAAGERSSSVSAHGFGASTISDTASPPPRQSVAMPRLALRSRSSRRSGW